MKNSQSSKSEFGKSTTASNRGKINTLAALRGSAALLGRGAFLAGALLFAACGSATRAPGAPSSGKPSDAAATLSSAMITSDNPGRLRLIFDAAVDVEAGDVSDFTLEGSANASAAASLYSGSGTKTLVLELDAPASAGETITLSYNFVIGEEKLTTNSNGKRVESIQGFSVTNGARDTIPPHLVSASIPPAAFTELVLVFSEPLDALSPSASGSALGFGLGSSNPDTLALKDSAFSLSGDNSTLTLTLAAPVVAGQSVWLDYDDDDDKVKDLAGNQLEPMAGFQITNQVPGGYPVTLDWNGGTVADGFHGPARPVQMSPSIGTSVTLPKAADYGTSKTGYTHTGWQIVGGAVHLFAADGYSYTPTDHVTFTAVWTADSYTITYDLGAAGAANHTGNPPTYTIADFTVTLQILSSAGWDFLGWYDNSGFKGEPVTSIPSGSMGPKFFYAKWAHPSAALSGAPVTVKAKTVNAGAVAANTTLTINLTDAKAAAVISGGAASWFSAAVPGLIYTAAAQPDATSITITVSGIPAEESFAAGVTITIPADKLVSPNGELIGNLAVTGTVSYIIGQSAGTPPSEVIQITGASVTITGSGSDGVFIAGRNVTLSPYRMAKYETTWELWDAVVRAGEAASKGYTFTDDSGWQGHQSAAAGTSSPTGTSNGPNKEKRAVTKVSWYDVIAWCNLYSEVSGLQPVYYKSSGGALIKNAATEADFATAYMDRSRNGFRLPTEAEWEFAARGGDADAAAWGYAYAGSDTPGDVAWYEGNSSSMTSSNANYGVHPVGTKPAASALSNWANSLGLYDMNGNVREWCWDRYINPVTSSDGSNAPLDPSGADSGQYRTIRGGGWASFTNYSTIACRAYDGPIVKEGGTGFRLVCPLE